MKFIDDDSHERFVCIVLPDQRFFGNIFYKTWAIPLKFGTPFPK